jgi:uncharacterized protein
MRRRRVLALALTIYLVGCVILAIGLAQLAFRPPRVPINQRPAAQAMAARLGAVLQDVSVIASDGVNLAAWFARPADANGNAVILLHGVGDNRQGMVGYAELFLSQGYSVLMPDSRAQGESGGQFATYGAKEANDVRLWYQWLTLHAGPNCVFGMGESMGAVIVLQAVKTAPFCAVVAESPFASFRQIAFIRVGQIFHTGSWLGKIGLRPAVELAFVYGKLLWGVNLAAVSPEASVAGSRVPILLIHGLADQNIPWNQSERIRARNSTDITLWEVPQAGHCGAVSAAPDQFNERVLGWFRDHESRSAHVVVIYW